jgi:hypothetical protein
MNDTTTPTPRTDKAVKESNGQWSYALVDTCKQLERELAAANQIMGELCESCGWAMRFPDQPCRCEIDRELVETQKQIEANHKGVEMLERMVYEARDQRDKLAEALRVATACPLTEIWFKQAIEALDALKP